MQTVGGFFLRFSKLWNKPNYFKKGKCTPCCPVCFIYVDLEVRKFAFLVSFQNKPSFSTLTQNLSAHHSLIWEVTFFYCMNRYVTFAPPQQACLKMFTQCLSLSCQYPTFIYWAECFLAMFQVMWFRNYWWNQLCHVKINIGILWIILCLVCRKGREGGLEKLLWNNPWIKPGAAQVQHSLWRKVLLLLYIHILLLNSQAQNCASSLSRYIRELLLIHATWPQHSGSEHISCNNVESNNYSIVYHNTVSRSIVVIIIQCN